MTETKKKKVKKRKQKRTNNRKKKKNRKEERERKQGKANGGMHIISVRVYKSGSVCTWLSYANNCSDDSGIFQSFNRAVTTARNDRSKHHVTDNETAAHHNIIKPSQSAYYLITKRL